MSATILQFVPRPRQRDLSLITPLDFMALNTEATLAWLKMLNEFADTSSDYTEPDGDCA